MAECPASGQAPPRRAWPTGSRARPVGISRFGRGRVNHHGRAGRFAFAQAEQELGRDREHDHLPPPLRGLGQRLERAQVHRLGDLSQGPGCVAVRRSLVGRIAQP